LYCQSPVGGGTILARGSFGLTPADRNVDLSFSAENVSTQFLAVLLRHIKKDVPEDIKATGRISTAFRVHSNENGDHVWAGNGESSAIEIRSNALTKPLELDSTKWHLIGPGIEQFTANVPPPSKKSNLTRARHEETLPVPDRTAFAFEPVALAIGGASPSTLSGWFSREGYVTELNGEAELTRLVEIGRLLGLPTPAAELSGSAKGTLQIAGTWAGFSLPDYNGNAQLQKVTAKLSGVASPLRIQSARFVADNASLSLTKASVEIEGTHTKLDLDATWPRNCVATQPTEMALCGMRFNVKADQLNIDELNSLVNPKAQKRPWYAAIAISVMGSDRRTFPATYASGQVSTGKLILKSVTATKASADVTITPSGFSIVGLRADTLGGSYVVDLAADFSDGTPAYSSSGNLVNLNIANIAALTHEIFASGKLTGSYKGTAHGWTYDDIVASLSGRADFDWRDGTLPHIELETKGKPLQFKVFKGTAELKNGVVTFPESKLATKSIYAVSGTATLGHELEVKLERKGEPGFSISGSLEHPKVVPVPTSIPETQATLKQTAK
jgi:hypothetical protein